VAGSRPGTGTIYGDTPDMKKPKTETAAEIVQGGRKLQGTAVQDASGICGKITSEPAREGRVDVAWEDGRGTRDADPRYLPLAAAVGTARKPATTVEDTGE